MIRPRVAHLTTVHHPSDPRIFWKEAASLGRAGFEVFLVAQHDQRETVEGVHLVPLPRVGGRYRRLLLQRIAYRRARALAASLYHIHDPELIPVAYALKRSTGAKIVYDMHENSFVQSSPERALVRALERWCFRWVDHVVLAEESYRSVLPGGTPHTVLLNYVRPFRPRRQTPKRLTPGSFRLLYAGAVSTERGLDTMLELAARIRDQALPWQITLAGKCYVARQRRAADLKIRGEGLQGVVRQIGWDTYVPWPDLDRHYADAEVGLALLAAHPNYVASIPTKFYEYLYYGLPMLCSDFPLWRQFVERHGCGAVASPDDVEQMLRVLRAWYEQPARYEQHARAALEAAPQYLWQVMEARILNLYRRLLRPPGSINE